MPITNAWMYGKRILSQRHEGSITGAQLTESVRDLQAMVRQGEAPVHVFIDASKQNSHSEVALADLKSLVPKVVEGMGWMVVVQPHALQRFFTSLGMQLAGAKYKFVKDEKAALEFLLEQDPTLTNVIR